MARLRAQFLIHIFVKRAREHRAMARGEKELGVLYGTDRGISAAMMIAARAVKGSMYS